MGLFKQIPSLFLQTLIVIALLSSCVKDEMPNPPPRAYSFFVAGHSYGNHLADNIHLHPPFADQFSYIREYPDISFGFLSGDIVRESNVESWDAVDEDMLSLEIPVYFAPGNHDVTNRELFETRYGDPLNNMRSYRYFTNEKDLFIILDSELDEWNISDEQFIFLKTVLNENYETSRNIFVFVHALIWWDDENIFQNIHTNWWPPFIPDTTNFWTDVEPLFHNISNPVYLFAGDLGANEQATPYMYYKEANITYIAGGMGNLVDDNFLFVSLNSAGDVVFDLIALQGDKHRFGKLEDYIFP